MSHQDQHKQLVFSSFDWREAHQFCVDILWPQMKAKNHLTSVESGLNHKTGMYEVWVTDKKIVTYERFVLD